MINKSHFCPGWFDCWIEKDSKEIQTCNCLDEVNYLPETKIDANDKDLMHYKGYSGSVHFNNKDPIFHGKIEFIKALVSYEATDANGLKKAFEEAVDDYIRTCSMWGQ